MKLYSLYEEETKVHKKSVSSGLCNRSYIGIKLTDDDKLVTCNSCIKRIEKFQISDVSSL